MARQRIPSPPRLLARVKTCALAALARRKAGSPGGEHRSDVTFLQLLSGNFLALYEISIALK